MAAKKAKRRLVIDAEAQFKARALIREASALLKKNNENVTEFRRAMKSDKTYGTTCKKGSCPECDAARLIRRADRIRAKAA